MPAPRGNSNAAGKARVKHPRLNLSLSGPTLELIYEALAADGNGDPSRQEVTDAVYYAIRQVYGRKVEDADAAIIL